MDFSNIANSVSVEKGFVLGRQRSILQMRSQNKVLILRLGDFAPTSELRPGSTRTLLAGRNARQIISAPLGFISKTWHSHPAFFFVPSSPASA